jgi:thiol-disulfide isomerase/thioredoxin
MITYSPETDLPQKYLLDFFSETCQPCMQMLRLLPKWSLDTGIDVVKVDVEKYPELSLAYKIRKVPTMIFVEDSMEKGRLVGVPRLLELSELVGAA